MRRRVLCFLACLCAGMIIANIVAAKIWLLPDYSMRQLNSYRVNIPGQNHDISKPHLHDPENYKCSAKYMIDPNDLGEGEYCAQFEKYGLRTCCKEVKCESDYQYTADACAAEQEGWVPSGVPCTAEGEDLYKACACSVAFQFVEDDNCHMPEVSAGSCIDPDGTVHYKKCTECKNGEYTAVDDMKKECKVCGSGADADYCDSGKQYCKNSSITDKTCDDGATCVNGECVAAGECIERGFNLDVQQYQDSLYPSYVDFLGYEPFAATFETCEDDSEKRYKYADALEFEVLVASSDEAFKFVTVGAVNPMFIQMSYMPAGMSNVNVDEPNDKDIIFNTTVANYSVSTGGKMPFTFAGSANSGTISFNGETFAAITGSFIKDINGIGYVGFVPSGGGFNIAFKIPGLYKIKIYRHEAVSNTVLSAFNIVGTTAQQIRLLNLNLSGVTGFDAEMGLANCTAVTSIRDALYGFIPNLPPNLENGINAFRACTNLFGPVPYLPDSLSVGTNMFVDSGLDGPITNLPAALTNAQNMFASTQITGNLPYLPEGLTSVVSMFAGTNISGSIGNLPEGITDGTGMFSGTQVSGEIPDLPPNLADGDYMFSGTKVSGVVPDLPATLTSAAGMFENCSGLTGALPDIPSQLKTADKMFFGCSGLNDSLTSLPSTITSAAQMFHGATGISAKCLPRPTGITEQPIKNAYGEMTDFGEESQIELAHDWTGYVTDCEDEKCSQMRYEGECYTVCGEDAITEDLKEEGWDYGECYDADSESLKYYPIGCLLGYYTNNEDTACYPSCGYLSGNIYSKDNTPAGTTYKKCVKEEGGSVYHLVTGCDTGAGYIQATESTTCELAGVLTGILCMKSDSFVEGSGPSSLDDSITSQFTPACCFNYYTYTDNDGTSYFKPTGSCPSGCMYIFSDGSTSEALLLDKSIVGCVTTPDFSGEIEIEDPILCLYGCYDTITNNCCDSTCTYETRSCIKQDSLITE